MADQILTETDHVSLCEALDRILNKGAVIRGEVTISVANVDLIYLGLRVMLSTIETARRIVPVHAQSPLLHVGAAGGTEISES